MKIKIYYDLCDGVDCNACIDVCPQNIFIAKEDGTIGIENEENCAYCKTCKDNCPLNCLTFI